MKNIIEQRLKTLFKDLPESTLKEAMYYALLAGGKRIRPILMLEVIKAYGHKIDDYLDIACAIECIHTYSLVHDDLPAMDDDDLRRGQPTVHKAYDEGLAILVGDALLTEAFQIIAKQKHIHPNARILCVDILSKKSGPEGMVYGQHLDLDSEQKDISRERLEDIHIHKTAHLIQAPLMMASALVCENDLTTWEHIGYHLGLMFQIQDDVLEVTSTEAVMGKSLSDQKNEKHTYIKHYGLEQSVFAIETHYKTIINYINTLKIDQAAIISLIDQIYHRTH